jgi:hypothetical protein
VKTICGILLVVSSTVCAAQVRPIKPIDPSQTLPVYAKGLGAVPGALICSDAQTVSALFHEYSNHWEEAMQDRVTGGQSVLLRGEATPEPKPADWGCALVKPGTRMLLEKGNVVPVVRVTLPNGNKIRGVTQASMFQSTPPDKSSSQSLPAVPKP